MSADDIRAKSKRRWRKVTSALVVTALLYVAFSAGWNHRWIDPRFVGAWRVTNSKSTHQSIYVLRKDGSAHLFEHNAETDRWWDVGPTGPPFYWSVGRSGFLMQNLDSPSTQFGGWLTSLGGLLTKGRLKWPRIARNSDDEIISVQSDRIRLIVPTPGIIIPLELTLDRIDPSEIPGGPR